MRLKSSTRLKAMRMFWLIGGILLLLVSAQKPAAAAESAGANVIFILDGSGSMLREMENQTKIDVAKARMTELVQELNDVNMGLITYGHHRKGDCSDIELMVPLGKGGKNTIIQQIQSISPKGKTPITQSIKLAVGQLETLEEEAGIVLVSDGMETCEGDPCQYVQSLKAKDIRFKLDVVGFDVSEEERKELECIARAGGGRYFTAQNTMQLKAAFTEVKKEVVKKTVAAKAEVTKWVPSSEPGLSLCAVLNQGGEPLKEDVAWDVFESAQDLRGNRKKISHVYDPFPILKLPTGRYYITARNGQALSSMEVDIVAGESKSAVMNMNAGHLQFQAVLADGGKPLKEDVAWDVFEAAQDLRGKRKKIFHIYDPFPLFKLSAGNYYITAKNGQALSSMEVEVTAGELENVIMNMNTGHLQFQAVLSDGGAPLKEDVAWDVYAPDQDLRGNREKIFHIYDPFPLFKLSAGRYYITARNGQALSSMEIEVAAGEVENVVMNMNAGHLQFQAVLADGGVPLKEDVAWDVFDAAQDLRGKRKKIFHIYDPFPLFKLSAGHYYITARNGQALSSMEIEVAAGESENVVMNMNAGHLQFQAIPARGAEPLQEDVSWDVFEAARDLRGKRKKIFHIYDPFPLFKLSAGRYYITAKHGEIESFTEVEVTAGETGKGTLAF